MTEAARVLGFGSAFDTVVAQEAHDQLVSLTSHRAAASNPPHQHVNNYICFVLAGSFAESSDGGLCERRAGTFFVHEAGCTHHDRFGPSGAVCLNVHLPSHEMIPRTVDGHCSAAASVAAGRLAFELAAGSCDELVSATLVAEIIGQIQGPGASRDDGSAWLHKVVQAISDEPRRRWSLAQLAAIVDRHPIHVAQVFRARTGMPLGAFQRLRRLASLGLELRLGTESLALLAAEFGYCDQPHMNAEFRAAFGTSPDRFRRRLH